MNSQCAIETKIKEILELVRPAVESHSGAIEFSRFDATTGIVYVTLGGACTGCPSSIFTLTFGIQEALQAQIPEITLVLPEE